MAITIGPDGELQLGSTLGLPPAMTTPVGALADIPLSAPRVDFTPVKNEEEGTLTIPTIELQTRDTGLGLGELQKVYGTKYMPMFQFVAAQQTGTYTFDPNENALDQEKVDELRQEFEAEHGLSADAAFNQQQELLRASQGLAGATGGRVGATIGAALAGDASIEQAIGEGFKSVNPFSFLGKKSTETSAAQAGRNIAGGSELARPDALFQGPMPQAEGFIGRVGTRLNPTTDAGSANLKMTGGQFVGDFLVQMATGADPMDAAKSAGKSAVLSYVANAIIPGSGPVVAFLSKFDIDLNPFN
jgi:hypothetical protein